MRRWVSLHKTALHDCIRGACTGENRPIMTGGDHHGHRQQEKQQHQRTPRSSPVEAPSTPVPTTARPLSPPASKYNDRTPPSQPSAPAAPAPTRSVRGAIAKYAPLFVALCGLLAATLVGWVYCSDGGGGWGVRPQSQQTANRGGGGGGGGSGPLLQGDAGKRRRSDSGVDGGGGGWVRFGQVTAGGGRSPSDPAGPNALAPEITEGGGDDETTSTVRRIPPSARRCSRLPSVNETMSCIICVVHNADQTCVRVCADVVQSDHSTQKCTVQIHNRQADFRTRSSSSGADGDPRNSEA